MKISTKLLIHGLANIVVATSIMAGVVLLVVYAGSMKEMERSADGAILTLQHELAEDQATPEKLKSLGDQIGATVLLFSNDARAQAEATPRANIPAGVLSALTTQQQAIQSQIKEHGYYELPFRPSWPLGDSRIALIAAWPAHENGYAIILKPADVILGVFVDLLIAFSVLGIGGALASGLGLLWSVKVSLSPILKMTKCMTDLAAGKLDAEVPAQGRRDEVGAMAEAVQVFKENAIEAKRLAAQQQQIENEAKAAQRKALYDLADMLDREVHDVIESLQHASNDLSSTAMVLGDSASTVLTETSNVNRHMQNAEGSMKQVEGAAGSMSDAIHEIRRNVENSRARTSHAVEVAERTTSLVASLQQAASRIGEVVGLINEIASKTNLLALNATIEAARAGEAGKGFAVVAGEVKQLANQTAQATKEITEQIADIRAIAENSVAAISQIHQSVRETDDASSVIVSAVASQSEATTSMTSSISLLASGTAQVGQSIREVKDGAEKTTSIAEEVLTVATELQGQVSHLGQSMQQIIRELRR